MDQDFVGATTLFCLFGATLMLYGTALCRTGNKDLLPVRAKHSVRTKADVKRVGKYTLVIGAAILAVVLMAVLLHGL